MTKCVSGTRKFWLLAVLVGCARVLGAQVACGDCDLDGVFPTIADALTAAQIAAGTTVPLPAQLLSCDVNSSGAVDPLDALRLAQAAAGLAVPLVCPAAPLLPSLADTVVFVIDDSTSGTSRTTSYPLPATTVWEGQKQWTKDRIDTMTPVQSLNVMLFNQSPAAWSTDLQPATPANRAAAKAFLDTVSPDGNSHYSGPSSMAVNMPMGAPMQVILVAAGAPIEGYAAVGTITSTNGGRARFDTVSFGVIGGSFQQILVDIGAQNQGSYTSYP